MSQGRLVQPPLGPPGTREDRKATGAFYTPPDLAADMLGDVLRFWTAPCSHSPAETCLPRTLDPACGDGVFLVEAFLTFCRHRFGDGAASWSQLLDLAQQCIYGIDQDEAAVQSARIRLAEAIVSRVTCDEREVQEVLRAEVLTRLESNVIVGDTLLDSLTDSHSSSSGLAAVISSGGFDAIVGNPPYVSIRQLTRWYPASYKRALKAAYRCAYRGYDLYVLFVERSFELLSNAGICSLIVPNKIATLDYARPCRELLLQQTTLLSIVDLSDRRIFRDAGVYPYVLTWQKATPADGHRIEVRRSYDRSDRSEQSKGPLQHELSAERGLTLTSQCNVEQRVPTQPLGELARLQCGTTGFSAQQLGSHLRERPSTSAAPGRPHESDAFPFIVSGSIRRYAIRDGNLRYMRKHYVCPWLPRDVPVVSKRKREMFASQKIVVSGMSRRLQAGWDARGRALGVGVYAIDRIHVDEFYLLGILNSSLLTRLFRLRFQAKRLSGDYLAINKGQLGKLPIRICDDEWSRRIGRSIADLARSITERSVAGSLTESLRKNRVTALIAWWMNYMRLPMSRSRKADD